MSPSHVAEPTYEAIRQRLMIGAWPMGFRLEAGRLAEDFGVRITPVRDALNRLVGERLVDLVPGIGFHVPCLTERGLRELLDLNMMLTLRAIEVGAHSPGIAVVDLPDQDHATRTEALFYQIASISGNFELVRMISTIGARLHVSRVHEFSVFPNATYDVDAICAALSLRGADLEGAVTRYHDMRSREASRLLASM